MAAIPEISIPVRVGGREFRLAAWFRDASEELVLFVHGLGCSKENFGEAWMRPELRGRSLLAFDLPGFGRSPRPDDFSYRLEDQARVLSAVIDAFALRRIYLVAHSMGGTMSLLMSFRGLLRLENLILVEPRLKKASSGLATEVSDMDFRQFESGFLPKFRHRTAQDSRVAFDIERADPRAFFKMSRSMVHWLDEDDLVERFLNAPCPRIFVYGKDNQHLVELQEIPSELQLGITDAGHFVMQDNPDDFYRYVASCFPGNREPGRKL